MTKTPLFDAPDPHPDDTGCTYWNDEVVRTLGLLEVDGRCTSCPFAACLYDSDSDRGPGNVFTFENRTRMYTAFVSLGVEPARAEAHLKFGARKERALRTHLHIPESDVTAYCSTCRRIQQVDPRHARWLSDAELTRAGLDLPSTASSAVVVRSTLSCGHMTEFVTSEQQWRTWQHDVVLASA